MINNPSIEKTKQLLKTEASPKIIIGQNDDYNRKMIEYGKFDILLSPESGNRKNSLMAIDSGLNHTLLTAATKNKVSIGIDLDEIRSLSKEQKAKRLEKIIQNLRFARKKSTKLAIKGLKDLKNKQSLLKSLGASSQQAAQALII